MSQRAGGEGVRRLSLTAGGARTEVVLGPGVLARGCELLSGHGAARLHLVSDEEVAPLYAAPLLDTLAGGGMEASLLTIPAGEGAKTLDTLVRLYEACQASGVERDDVVLAVGGGVVGDVAGMLAGTYMRGLEFVQVPTTLVSMVTSSVGGKTGVNFRGQKNLIGVYKQPSLVIADTDTLRTLPEVEFRSGLGELVTVGVLGAPEIFEALEADAAAPLAPLIAAAVECKGAIVEADPLDRLGVRARLNLGHTFGHALEALSGYELAHGLAVAVGLCIASRVAAALGLCPAALAERIRLVVQSLGLLTALTGYEPQRVIEAMRGDKKRVGGRLRFVLPVRLGEVRLVGEEELPAGLLADVLRQMVWEGQS